MSTNFPTSLDTLTNPAPTDALDSVAVPHAEQHANANDAIEALQAKVGIDSSAVATSLDYRVVALEARPVVTNGNSHDHSGGDGAQIDHGGLAGLSNDDHAQYHNNSRGDARYIKQGKHTIWVPAAAMTPRTTNGAAPGTTETATNKLMLSGLDFDASTIEYAQFAIQMPESWDEGTITAKFTWKHAATTTNFGVSWGIQGVALSDDDAADAAFGTAIYANDTGGTTGDIYRSPETAAVTIAGAPAAGDYVVFQVLRKADDGTNDTLAIDAGLLGVSVFYTIAAGTD
jgi:hypothetical protein